MWRLLIISLCLIWPGLANAQSQKTDIRPDANRLIGDTLLSALIGVTHEGAYQFSEEGQPGRFYSEAHHKSGKTTYIEGEIKTDGAWIIRKEVVCYLYPNIDLQGGCFRVYQVGNCYYFYNDSIPEFSDELDRDYWTARSVKQGQIPNCEPGIS